MLQKCFSAGGRCLPWMMLCAGSLGWAQASPRAHAGYVLADGSVQMVAPATMAGAVRALDGVFTAAHPGTRFTVVEGDNYTSMSAVTFDKTVAGPLGCPFTRIGLGNNLKIAAEPVAFRVGHATLKPGVGVPALGVIVNASNPIESLSLGQLTRMLTVGAAGGDLTMWGQAGVKGAFGSKQIAPAGPLWSDERESDDPEAGEFVSVDKMGGLIAGHAYRAMPHYADVVTYVRETPGAVGLVALNVPLDGVKVLPLRYTETGAAVAPTVETIGSGRYPLDRYVYLYVRAGKGMPLDEYSKEYVRQALSDEGQKALAAEGAGYVPLSAGERAEELGRLAR